MVGEKNLIPIVEEQFLDFLKNLDKYGLSHNTKVEIYARLQISLNNQLIKESIEYGRKLEKNKSNSNKPKFTEEEELIISQYVSFFQENGTDAQITFLHQPTLNDKRLVEEAINRVKKAEKSK